jgi:hypothetical protein
MKEENRKLLKLPVKDFAKKIICDGHLYMTVGHREFHLMNPGVFIDASFIKKHAVNNNVFDYDCVVSFQVKEKFKTYFKELRSLKYEKDLRKKCTQIIKYFAEVFLDDTHFLSFVLACHEEFCLMPLDHQAKMHETDTHLYRKALYSSAFSIIVAMTNDFYHYLMLKDFFNLTFSLDYGLCEDSYSYSISEACNIENKKPGSGKLYLDQQMVSASEKEVFFAHPEKSYQYMNKKSCLSFPELSEAILYQHELSDGTGFPRGILKGQVSSWEAVVILSDSLVDILPNYHFECDVIKYLMNFQNSKLKELPVNRIYKKLCMGLDFVKSIKATGS